MSKPGFFEYFSLTIAAITGFILILAGSVTHLTTTVVGVAIIVAALGIEGSFVRALKAMNFLIK